MNLLLSQCLSDFMLLNIKINNKKKFKVENIINERKINHDSHKKFQYKIK